MTEPNDENSITQQSITSETIDLQSFMAGEAAEDENETSKVGALILSPQRPILLDTAQSPVVHLQREFDDNRGYESDDGPYYDAIDDEGPLIVDEITAPENQNAPILLQQVD
jgi:hypothetical protein